MNQPKCPRVRTSFAKLDQPLPVPNLIDIQKASWKWFLEEGLKETIEDISPIRDYSEKLLVEFGEYSVRRALEAHRGVPQQGHDLLRAAHHGGALHQRGDRRDPRADGLHGRLPHDDRARHLHHPRHRARGRHAARALAGRLHHGAQAGRARKAGADRQPHAAARLLARARDRQEGRRQRPHRPQAQVPGERAAARHGLRRAATRSSSSSTSPSTSRTRSTATPRPRRRSRSSSSSASSVPASRRPSSRPPPCCAASSSTPSATTSRASAVTSSTRACTATWRPSERPAPRRARAHQRGHRRAHPPAHRSCRPSSACPTTPRTTPTRP